MKNNLNNRIDHHETQAFFLSFKWLPCQNLRTFSQNSSTWNPETINILGDDLSSLGGTMEPMVEEVISQVASTIGNAIGIGHS